METCKGDGICADICSKNVLKIIDGKAVTVESRVGECIMFGQCVAVCPAEALQMPKLPAEDFKEL
jgi:NAD-dependent dihydropyrimidine dehydrogenase PreA subunit